MKKSFLKKSLAILATVTMVLMLMPLFPSISASAETVFNIGATAVNIVDTGDYVIEGTTLINSITVNASGKTVNVTLRNANVQVAACAFKIVAGTVNLTLTGTNRLVSGNGAGLENAANLLNISGDGTLTAQGSPYSAGIGGANGVAGSNITFNGGTITATGGEMAAGIGGGNNAIGNNIVINSGNITAVGGATGGTGIGSGWNATGSKIIINGGTVNAQGGVLGAGIGGGYLKTDNDITINGGTVVAQGGQFSAGIGGGYQGEGGSIKINGGSIKAVAGHDALNNIGGGLGKPAVTPKNSRGLEVALVSKDILSDIEKAYLAQLDQNVPYYNLKDAKLIDNKFYLYLPKYKITYGNLNGATNTNPAEYNILSNFTLTDLVKNGHTFYGWYKDLTDTTRIFAIPTGSIGDKALYARWSATSNHAPIMNPITPITSETGKQITIVVTGSDEDGNTLTYSASDLPAGSTFNPATRTFTWTANAAQLGNYAVKFTVSDGQLNDVKVAAITIVNTPVYTNATQLIAETVAYINHEVGTKQSKSLVSKLNNVVEKLAKGDKTAALNQMKAFMNEVAAQSGKKIDKADAKVLLDKAKLIIKAINPQYVIDSKKINDDDDDDDHDNGNGKSKDKDKDKGKGKGKSKK